MTTSRNCVADGTPVASLNVPSAPASSETIGRVRILAHDADEFLGATLGLNQMSERLHEQFDDEIRSLLEDAEGRAKSIVEYNRTVLDSMVTTLLDRETLEGAHLLDLLAPVAKPNGTSKPRRARATESS